MYSQKITGSLTQRLADHQKSRIFGNEFQIPPNCQSGTRRDRDGLVVWRRCGSRTTPKRRDEGSEVVCRWSYDHVALEQRRRGKNKKFCRFFSKFKRVFSLFSLQEVAISERKKQMSSTLRRHRESLYRIQEDLHHQQVCENLLKILILQRIWCYFFYLRRVIPQPQNVVALCKMPYKIYILSIIS